jgi:tetratricopeptide (TPR) repeat protein
VLEEKRLLEAASTDDAPLGLRMHALRALTAAAIGLNDSEAVVAASTERLELARAADDLEQQAAAMNMLASGAAMAGDHETARQWFEASVSLEREIGNRAGLTAVLGNFARLERDEGDLAKSRQLLEESLVIAREDEDEVNIAWVDKELATTAIQEGALDEARALLEEGLEFAARFKLTVIAGDLVFALAQLASKIGRTRESAVLFGAFVAYNEREGWEVSPTSTWWWALRDELTVALGADEFEALMAEGRSLDHDSAVHYANECLDHLRNPKR